MRTNRIHSALTLLLLLAACEDEQLNYPPIAGHPDDTMGDSGREVPSTCPPYISCREACPAGDGECRLECAEVVETDHEACVDERCEELAQQCGGGIKSACVALPRCDDDVVEAGSTSTDDTGESSSGDSTETDEDPSSSTSSGSDSGTTGEA